MIKSSSLSEIQGVLSIGYVYLILLGILNETLYYNQIEINILNYSSILDVLISPIATLTSKITKLIVFILLLFLAFTIPATLAKKKDTNWFKKSFKLDETLSENEVKSKLLKLFLVLFAIGLFGLFIGAGSKKGEIISEKIKNKKLDYNDKIKFITGEVLKVEIVGINSTYIFYLEKENQKVQISPISGIIKGIEEIK